MSVSLGTFNDQASAVAAKKAFNAAESKRLREAAKHLREAAGVSVRIYPSELTRNTFVVREITINGETWGVWLQLLDERPNPPPTEPAF